MALSDDIRQRRPRRRGMSGAFGAELELNAPQEGPPEDPIAAMFALTGPAVTNKITVRVAGALAYREQVEQVIEVLRVLQTRWDDEQQLLDQTTTGVAQ